MKYVSGNGEDLSESRNNANVMSFAPNTHMLAWLYWLNMHTFLRQHIYPMQRLSKPGVAGQYGNLSILPTLACATHSFSILYFPTWRQLKPHVGVVSAGHRARQPVSWGFPRRSVACFHCCPRRCRRRRPCKVT